MKPVGNVQGYRLATSVGGVLTGRGTDIIIDDPLKPEEASPQAQRQATNEWYGRRARGAGTRMTEETLAEIVADES